jgi:hypothetical protein
MAPKHTSSGNRTLATINLSKILMLIARCSNALGIMGSGFGKTKKTDFGKLLQITEKEYEAMKWCIKNGITIGPLAAEKG